MNTLNTTNPNSYQYATKHLEFHILGGIKLNKLESLRVTLSMQKLNHENIIRHTIDLYNDNQVEKLIRKVAERLEIGTSVVRRTLQELTHELENYRFLLLDKQAEQAMPTYKQLTEKEKNDALKLGKRKGLLKETDRLIALSGVIGEIGNRQTMYLIFTSRLTNNPLHCISLGSSGAGKTHLQSAIASLMPEEDIIEITYLSANALYYFARTELSHKIIIIEDLDGAQAVLYPLRELQTKNRITKTVVHKDKNGITKTIHLTVEGPVCIAGCTTQESIYEDNSNRSFLLYIDESPEQDGRIMHFQKLVSAGKINIEEQLQAKRQLQNLQRILKPIKVINPYAEFLELPLSVFKPRRTNSHYLQFIEVITFYKQYQREQKVNKETGEIYIETTLEDIEDANELITEVLLRKSDLLNGACRTFFQTLKSILIQENQTTFTNSEVRRWMRLPKSTIRRRFLELLDTEHIARMKDKNKKTYRYELVDKEEYSNLKATIAKALQDCIDKINRANGSD